MIKAKIHRGANGLNKASRRVVASKTTLLICLIFFWTIAGPNLFGFERVEAAISYRGSSTTRHGDLSKSTTITINKPAGVIEGDVMIASLVVEGSPALTAPSGWTDASGTASAESIGDASTLRTYFKPASASEPASYSWTYSGSTRRSTSGIAAFAGVNAVSGRGVNVKSSNKETVCTSFTALSVTPTNPNTTLVAIYGGGDDSAAQNTTDPTGMTQAYDIFTDELLNTDTHTSVYYEDYAGGTAATGDRVAGAGTTYDNCNSQLFALEPAVHGFELSAFKWFTNVNSIDFLGISDDVDDKTCGPGTTLKDKAISVAHDPLTSAVYMAGYSGCNGEQWHIERRGTEDGVPVDTFGSNGAVTYDGGVAGTPDRAQAVVVDNQASGNIFVGGYETVTSSLANNKAWRIEKLTKSSGARVSGFGTGGVITLDHGQGSGKDDAVTAMYLTADDFLYIAGEDSSPAVDGTQWRIEKRNAITGALCDGSLVGDTPVCVGGTFGTGGVVTSNPTSGGDIPAAITVDEAYGYIYIAGQENTTGDSKWRVEKRNAISGALCTSTSACSEGAFNGTSGFYVINPSGNNSAPDPLYAVEVEIKSASEKYVYLGGSEKSGGDQQWRMQKLNGLTGAVITGFGSSGIINVNPDGKENDYIVSFAVDSRYDHVYIVGSDGGNTGASSRDFKWRVEKRNSINGNRCDGTGSGVTAVCGQYQYVDGDGVTQTADFPAYGGTDGDAAGVATSNPVAQADNVNDNDQPRDMVIHKQSTSSFDGSLYIIGFDRGIDTTGEGDTQWRLEKRNLLDGTRQFDMEALSPTNVAARPQKVSMQVRLRMLMHLDPANIYTTDTLPAFKLQYSPKVGTCDTLFTGETYVDVTTSTADIQWLDNSSAADGEIPRELGANDPGHNGHVNIIQGYEEANPFNVRKNQLAGQDGLWDFALKDMEAFGSFCFRSVHAAGSTYPENTTLDASGGSYSYIPEISFCLNPPTEVLTRHGGYFCGNVENAFFWSMELEI